LSNPDNRVEYELWYSSVFDLSTEQIKEIGEYNQPFANNVLFTPRIMTFECDVCPSFVKVKSCVSNGKYCPYAPKSSSTNDDMVYDEIEIMKENLLEKCLYQHIVDRDGENVNYKDWFNYMISMREDIEKHSNVAVKVPGLGGKI